MGGAGGGHDKRILFGAFLELLLIVANIGTAVVIVPIMRRFNEELAIGYVTARIFECTFILVGIVSVVGIITLRNQVAGASEGTVAFTLAAIGVAMLAPLYAVDAIGAPLRWPTAGEIGAVLYIAVAASVIAFLAWNRGVAVVGANAAGFTLPLLPAFGTALAMLFLGEAFQGFHAMGFIAIVAGVSLATSRR